METDLRRWIRLCEASRAPVYHATGLTTAVAVLRDGFLRSEHNYISVSRDPRFRYSPGDDQADTFFLTTGGNAPVQFVLDTDAVRSRFKIDPYDWAGSELDLDWNNPSHRAFLRHEREERIYTKALPVNRQFIQKIILEPVTSDYRAWAHGFTDAEHLLDDDGQERADAAKTIKRLRYEIAALARRRGIPIVDRPGQ